MAARPSRTAELLIICAGAQLLLAMYLDDAVTNLPGNTLPRVMQARYEDLLASHPSIVFFLTMLVGAGGNAGNQAAVRGIRGLATGDLNGQTISGFLLFETKMAAALAALLLVAGLLRTAAFGVNAVDTMAISLSLFTIVSTSIILGAILPILLHRLRVDAAHAATSVQVLMDVLGVFITCAISTAFYSWL
mmetsp:Transcript_18324/g.55311  ORF Transcript_18324/g.55311 Transcript_18324/m.55311 type:complete len:191 (-) Transcript_18324:150-722(-)